MYPQLDTRQMEVAVPYINGCIGTDLAADKVGSQRGLVVDVRWVQRCRGLNVQTSFAAVWGTRACRLRLMHPACLPPRLPIACRRRLRSS